MHPRLRIRTCRRDGRYVLKLDGEVDGSTACRALDALSHVPPETLEVVLDLSALTVVEAFGLEVLGRGLRRLLGRRRVCFQGSPRLLPVLTALASSLTGEHRM